MQMETIMQRMMARFPLFIMMGLVIVLLSVVIGAINATDSATYYAVDKATRDASTSLATLRAGIERTLIWLPYFKFLGVAMILGGITMALGIIATKLQKMGEKVLGAAPPRPRTVMWMRMFMMVGMLIIIAGFIVSLNAAAVAAAVYSQPVTAIDAAASGSTLLGNLAAVHATEAWLEAFKFVGNAFLFLGIVNGLSTIIFALRYQQQALPSAVRGLSPELEPGTGVAVPTD